QDAERLGDDLAVEEHTLLEGFGERLPAGATRLRVVCRPLFTLNLAAVPADDEGLAHLVAPGHREPLSDNILLAKIDLAQRRLPHKLVSEGKLVRPYLIGGDDVLLFVHIDQDVPLVKGRAALLRLIIDEAAGVVVG